MGLLLLGRSMLVQESEFRAPPIIALRVGVQGGHDFVGDGFDQSFEVLTLGAAPAGAIVGAGGGAHGDAARCFRLVAELALLEAIVRIRQSQPLLDFQQHGLLVRGNARDPVAQLRGQHERAAVSIDDLHVPLGVGDGVSPADEAVIGQ